MGVPIKKTVVFEANIHNTHRRISEIMFTNFFPPPTGVRYLVTWLRLNILLPFCVQHPLSLQTCCFKTTNFKQKRMFTNKCYYKESLGEGSPQYQRLTKFGKVFTLTRVQGRMSLRENAMTRNAIVHSPLTQSSNSPTDGSSFFARFTSRVVFYC